MKHYTGLSDSLEFDAPQAGLTRRQFLQRTIALGIGASALAGLAAACATEDGDAPQTVPSPATDDSAEDDDEVDEESEADEDDATPGAPAVIISGGSLSTAIEADPITLDPAFTSSLPGRRVGRAIFDPLVDLDEDGGLIPALAESWDQPDDSTYVLHLRQNVSFHDGTPFDAEAVQFHFDRHLNPENNSLRRGELMQVESTEILDSHTIQINLRAPFAPFLYTLFDWSGFIVSPTAAQDLGDDFGVRPVGTGPFRLVEYISDQHAVVERNSDYWDPDRPNLDEIIFRPIPVDTSRLTELRTGGVQIAEDLPYQDVERMQEMAEIVLSEKQGFRFEFLAFQTEHEPFGASRAFRQALNWTLDREAIHQSVYFGTGQIGYSPLLPGTPFFNPDYQPFTRDVDRARELIEEADLPSTEFTVWVGPDPVVQRKAQIIQSNFQDIGIMMNIQNEDSSSVTTRLVESDFDLFIGRWWGYRPDPDQYLSTLVHSAGSNNYSHYANEEVDELLDEARSIDDIDTRREHYQRVSEILNEDAANIYYHSGSNFKGLSPEVQNFVHMQDSIVRYKDIELG